MSDTSQETDTILPLTPVEARVVASLVEKEMTTPEYYPLTVNALKAACNQKSNREPELSLTEAEIQAALETLRYDKHLVWQVSVSGSRVPKYRHNLPDAFGFSPPELAVLSELMLRGPQTVGELRTHAKRMHAFESPATVQQTLDELMHWNGRRLATRLAPGPGRREPRYAHLLCGETAVCEESEPTSATRAAAEPAEPDRVEALRETVDDLRSGLAELRREFEELRRALEG